MGSIQQQESPAEVTNGGYKLGAFCIDEPRRMKVVIIGAGFSGAYAFFFSLWFCASVG